MFLTEALLLPPLSFTKYDKNSDGMNNDVERLKTSNVRRNFMLIHTSKKSIHSNLRCGEKKTLRLNTVSFKLMGCMPHSPQNVFPLAQGPQVNSSLYRHI